MLNNFSIIGCGRDFSANKLRIYTLCWWLTKRSEKIRLFWSKAGCRAQGNRDKNRPLCRLVGYRCQNYQYRSVWVSADKSSTVQTLTQVKAWSGFMAVVVYSCCRKKRFISQLYKVLLSEKEPIDPTCIVNVHCYSTLILRRTNDTGNTRVLASHVMYHWMMTMWRVQVLFIYSPSPHAKVSKTPIRINPLVSSLCGK